jgi:hypothetical protein
MKTGWMVPLVLALTACDPAEDVRVQPLPPLTLPSPERRVGLPEVTGPWRFVRFALPPAQDTLAEPQSPTPPGQFLITAQRLDSLAGFYVSDTGRFPVVGEVRRDGVVSLATFSAEGGRFAAGRIIGDTLWIELTSFGIAEAWPRGTRAAFSRSPPPPPPVPQDTVRPDTAVLPAAPGVQQPPAAPPQRLTPPPALPGRPLAPTPAVPMPAPPPPDTPPPVPPDTSGPAVRRS